MVYMASSHTLAGSYVLAAVQGGKKNEKEKRKGII